MDGFTGLKTAAIEELPGVTPVMDPFHVIRLAGSAVEDCRRRIQQDTLGRRGMRGDPLYQARRTLLTGAALLTAKQQARLNALFSLDEHAAVEATWGVYQDMITAYRESDRGLGRFFLEHTIDRISTGVPAELVELRRLARTMKQRALDVLAYFDRPGTSNGPQRRSTDGSRTCAVPPSASATSRTTSRDRYSNRRLQTRATPSIVKSRLSASRKRCEQIGSCSPRATNAGNRRTSNM